MASVFFFVSSSSVVLGEEDMAVAIYLLTEQKNNKGAKTKWEESVESSDRLWRSHLQIG